MMERDKMISVQPRLTFILTPTTMRIRGQIVDAMQTWSDTENVDSRVVFMDVYRSVSVHCFMVLKSQMGEKTLRYIEQLVSHSRFREHKPHPSDVDDDSIIVDFVFEYLDGMNDIKCEAVHKTLDVKKVYTTILVQCLLVLGREIGLEHAIDQLSDFAKRAKAFA